MYKVLLVDDKPWVLEDIKNIIDWEQQGFKIIGTAENGSDAFNLIRKNPPDIIFSDIEMPDINGFELLEKVNSRYRGIVTVFISAYDKFSYARDAIRLGAFDYLLKPVEKDGLITVLKKVAGELKKRKEEIDNKVMLLFLNYISDYLVRSNGSGSFFKDLNEAGYSITGKNFVLGIIKTEQNPPILSDEFKDSEIEFYCVPLGKKRYAFFAGFPANTEGKKNIEKQLNLFSETYNATVGISTVLDKTKNIDAAISQADIAVEQDFITGSTGVYFYRKQDTAPICERIRAIKSRDEMHGFIDNLEKFLSQQSVSIEGLNDVCREIFNHPLYENINAKTILQSEPKFYVESYNNISDLIEDIREPSYENSQQPVSNALINEIIKTINENYGSRVLIQEFAKKFNLNPNYLSSLFKSVCGKSFTSYLTELRLKKAKELLKDSSLSLYEISDRVGYDDYFHFSKIFKKYNGLSPGNFRKKTAESNENT